MSSTPPSVVTISFLTANGKCITNIFEGAVVVTLNILTSIAGIVFNSVVGITVARTQNLRTNFGFLICSLSLADLLLSLVVKPMLMSLIVPTIGYECSPNPDALHNTTIVLSFAFNAASMGTLFFISVDRCLCVVFPIKYPVIVTRARIKSVIGVTWLGTGASIVNAFVLDPAITNSEAMRIIIVTGLCVTYLVIFLCYSMIYSKIRKQNSIRDELQGSNHRNSTRSVRVGGLRSSISSYSHKKERKLALTMALVIVIFTCSWAPLGYVVLAARHQTFDYSTVIWAVTVGFANSAINPVLYFFRSEEYRNASKRLLARFYRGFTTTRNPDIDCVRKYTTQRKTAT